MDHRGAVRAPCLLGHGALTETSWCPESLFTLGRPQAELMRLPTDPRPYLLTLAGLIGVLAQVLRFAGIVVPGCRPTG